MAAPAGHPPIISLANFESRKEDITEQLMAAATHSGFLYVSDSGIPQELIDAGFEANKRYFQLPAEEKAKLPEVDWASQSYTGHNPGNKSSGTVVREGHWKWWSDLPVAEAAYPAEELVPGFKESTKALMAALPPVFDKILACFSVGLGFPQDHFKKVSNMEDPDNRSVFICNHYPATEGHDFKPGAARITAHTDETLITLLMTSPGSAGLELAAGKDGKAVDSQVGLYEVEEWHPCPHIPGCITVNIGDALMALSDGVLKSNYHRVRMPAPGEPTGERYSQVGFVWPTDSTLLQGPLKKFPPITFKQFMDVKSQGFAYILSKEEAVYDSVQELNVALGMPTVTAAA